MRARKTIIITNLKETVDISGTQEVERRLKSYIKKDEDLNILALTVHTWGKGRRLHR